MRSKTAAVLLVLSSVALLFGVTTATASAAVSAHAEVAVQAAALSNGLGPIGLTGFSSFVVLLGLVGLAVGLTRLGRRSRAAKRAAVPVEAAVSTEEPARTSA